MPRTHVQAPMWHPGDLGLLLHSFGNQFQSHTHPKRPKTSPGYRFQKLRICLTTSPLLHNSLKNLVYRLETLLADVLHARDTTYPRHLSDLL